MIKIYDLFRLYTEKQNESACFCLHMIYSYSMSRTISFDSRAAWLSLYMKEYYKFSWNHLPQLLTPQSKHVRKILGSPERNHYTRPIKMANSSTSLTTTGLYVSPKSKGFPFIKLPAEMRIKIYESYFVSLRPPFLFYGVNGHPGSNSSILGTKIMDTKGNIKPFSIYREYFGETEPSFPIPALLYASSQIRSEASNVFLKHCQNNLLIDFEDDAYERIEATINRLESWLWLFENQETIPENRETSSEAKHWPEWAKKIHSIEFLLPEISLIQLTGHRGNPSPFSQDAKFFDPRSTFCIEITNMGSEIELRAPCRMRDIWSSTINISFKRYIRENCHHGINGHTILDVLAWFPNFVRQKLASKRFGKEVRGFFW